MTDHPLNSVLQSLIGAASAAHQPTIKDIHDEQHKGPRLSPLWDLMRCSIAFRQIISILDHWQTKRFV